MFDIKKIKQDAKKDYEKTWLETARLLKKQGKYWNLDKRTKTHALFDFFLKVRETLLDLGFEEVVLPMIVEDKEVLKQYGPEGNVILDRVFYLAGLPRPDIGISDKKIKTIKKIIPGFDKVEELKNIFREYKKGKIESDDLVETITKRLKVKEEQATEIIDKVFPEFKKIKPIPTNLTLRSHTTALWFPVLSEMKKRQSLPLQLFSIGQKFRREQKLDSTHLNESWTASIVILAEKISLEDGQRIVRKILEKLGYRKVEFKIKKGTSKYYAPQTEFEVFIKHPKTKELIEVGDGGLYSPVSLAKYDIEYPVFNIGFGLERIVMLETGITDIRKLVYPYFYEEVEFSDSDIANAIKIEKEPKTDDGKSLVSKIYRVATEHANDPSPCKVEAYRGKFLGKQISVKIVEKEKGKKLLSFATLNPVIVKDGNIIGAMPDKIPKGSVKTDYNYLLGITNLVVHEIENAIRDKKSKVRIRIPIVKRISDINLTVDESVSRFIESKGKKIDIRGPVFAEFIIDIS